MTQFRGRVFVKLPRLRGVRESRGWSQRELAQRSGVSYVNISRIEHRSQRATMDTAEKLARALRINLLNELIVAQEEERSS